MKILLKSALGAPYDPPGPMEPKSWISGSSFSHFWVPFRVQKSSQNRSLAKKVTTRIAFSSIFCCTRCFYHFFVDFDSFFIEKSLKKTMWLLNAVCIFLNLATFTKHCILQVRSYVFSFWVFVIFVKKRWKNNCKIGYTKIIEKWGQEGPKIATKWLRINEKTPENLKNHQKISFGRYMFFNDFLSPKKTKS